MINVKVNHQDHMINLHISGHANMGEYGSDIVCSAVSCLCFSIANSMLKLDNHLQISAIDNEFVFTAIPLNHDNELLINTLVDGLKSIYEQYPQAIKIMEVEAC